jgi:hypothetical protein
MEPKERCKQMGLKEQPCKKGGLKVQQEELYRRRGLKEQQEEPCKARGLKKQPCTELESKEQQEQSCKVKGLNKMAKHFDMRSKTELLKGNPMENQTACRNFQVMSTAG